MAIHRTLDRHGAVLETLKKLPEKVVVRNIFVSKSHMLLLDLLTNFYV